MGRNNSPAARARKAANLEHWSAALEGFAGQYDDIELEVFGTGIHWRLSNTWATLDVWPTTGKYWIKDVPFGRGFSMKADERLGWLPWDYNKLDKFLKALFGVDDE